MAVANQNVWPSIIVHIEKAAAPAKKLRVTPKTSGEGGVLKRCAAHVVVERRRIAGEIGFNDVKVAVQIVVCRADAHAGLRLAVGAERASRLDGNVHEFSIFLVLI